MLKDLFLKTRQDTLDICKNLCTDDYNVQPCADVSPPKWHLAHTSWFFETFILQTSVPNYQFFFPEYQKIFNSYYTSINEPWQRDKRGVLSRPSLKEILDYRSYVDTKMLEILNEDSLNLEFILTGLHHEHQHQELLWMDIKYILGQNPLHPPYHADIVSEERQNGQALDFIPFAAGLTEVGVDPQLNKSTLENFYFDNETPRHQVFLQSFAIANRPVCNGEYLEFIQSGGYRNEALWLSDGWKFIQSERIGAPLYWFNESNRWYVYDLSGLKEMNPHDPVMHVSYYEADAFARWTNKRLPTEFEWEFANQSKKCGAVWEWTQSSYHPYPRYQAPKGKLREYNSKFMCNQFILRGGSKFTPSAHYRPTYRNYFYPQNRWQFCGFRLVEDR